MRGAFLEDLSWPEAGDAHRRGGGYRGAGRGGGQGARATPPAQDRLPGRPGARAACRRGATGARRAGHLVRLLPGLRPLPGEPAPPGGNVHGARDGCPDGLCRPRGAPAGDHQYRGLDRGADPDRRAGLLRGPRRAGRGRRPGNARASRPVAAPPEARRPCGRTRDLARPRHRAARRADGAGGARLRPCAGRPCDRLLPAGRLRRSTRAPAPTGAGSVRAAILRSRPARPARPPSGRSRASWWKVSLPSTQTSSNCWQFFRLAP